MEASLNRKIYRTGEIAQWLRSEIESGALLPGARLEERSLSERFGVSKTPVREALIQLSSIGLVELRQRRGAIVTVLSVEQVVSMFEVMTELESMAAKLAALRMSRYDRAALLRQHHRCEQCSPDDAEAYNTLNREFHEIIYRGACNGYLQSSIKDARSRLRAYRKYPFQKSGRIAQSVTDHAQIVAALLHGDADKAGRVMRDHIMLGGRVFADLVAQMKQLD